MRIPFVESPNFSERKFPNVCGIVIHYTAGGSAKGSIDWLCNPQSRASAHYVISRSGDVAQLVRLKDKAWHAGVAEMEVDGEMLSDPSRFTIGIELANHGLLQKIGSSYFYEIGREIRPYKRTAPEFAELVYDSGLVASGWWEPYPDAQIDALQQLLVKISEMPDYKAAAENLIGHEEIGMPLGRKKDPGPLFPWKRFVHKTERRTRRGK